MFYDQSDYNIKCEWGIKGAQALFEVTEVFIIADILSFSTCVDICVNNGAEVYPYLYNDKSAAEFADSKGAELAVSRKTISAAEKYSLSPNSLKNIPKGKKLVLPSPNGSAISLALKNKPVICGCLRNAKAAAEYAMSKYKNISFIPACEKWEDGSMRFAVEDIIGTGAIISFLKGNLSPESRIALAFYDSVKDNLVSELKNCTSGKELIDRGYEIDIEIASEMNVSKSVPVLIEKRFIAGF
jgi:2-phosphosulfolactate phosphatase